MAIKELKFAESEFSGQDIASLPDRPNDAGMTAAQLKARFDQIGKVMLALGRYNDLIDALTEEGAKDIGAAVEGLSGEDVQTLLTALKAYEDAHRERQDNPHEVTKAQLGMENVDNTPDAQKPVSEAQQAAIDALEEKVLTKENTGEYTPTAPYHPATKEYVDQTALEAGAVRSVFGRAGAVTAQKGDYTAEMVGARPDNWMPTAEETGARPNDWMPTAEEVGAAPATHAIRHAAGGSDPITPTAIGAVSKSGDTMTGNLNITKSGETVVSLNNPTSGHSSQLVSGTNVTGIRTLNKTGSYENARAMLVASSGAASSVMHAAQLEERKDNVTKKYFIFGEHNKPSGTYTGNGSATQRKIPTKGIGEAVVIESNNGSAIITSMGAITWSGSSVSSVAGTKAEFDNTAEKNIVLATNDTRLNENGVVYYWKVL